MTIFTRFCLLAYFFLRVISVVPPPSPGRVPSLINNPFLDPKVYESYLDYDYSNVPSNAIEKMSENAGEPPKQQRKQFTSDQERKEAKLIQERDYKRKERNMYKNLPEGDPKKEAVRLRDRINSQRRRTAIKSLPDGHPRKEEFLRKDRQYGRNKRLRMKSLPDGDEEKQKYFDSIKASKKRHIEKKKLQNPEYLLKIDREKKRKRRQSIGLASYEGV